jgi:energy-coupling factor transporter transmembrane protein EcfT
LETLLILFLILIASLVILFAIRFLRATFKVVTKLILVVIILLIILTIFVYRDLGELKDDLATKKSVFVLRENNTYYAAVGIDSSKVKTFDLDSFDYYTKAELEQLKLDVKKDNFTDKGVGRIFIVTPELINKSYKLDMGLEIDENDIIEILKSEEPYEVLAKKLSPEFSYSAANLANAYGDEGKIKGYLLAASIINYFQITDFQLASDMKKSNIEVLPSSLTFTIIKYMPFI